MSHQEVNHGSRLRASGQLGPGAPGRAQPSLSSRVPLSVTRRILLACCLAAITAAVGAAPATAAERKVPPLFYGANWDGDFAKLASDQMRESQHANMAESGVESVR